MHTNSSVDGSVASDAWNRQAIEYVQAHPQTDRESPAIVQHHGLATRLDDWSTNPINAAYFPAREERESRAIIFAAKFQRTVSASSTSPMTLGKLALFRPRGVVPRITRQGGLFSVHAQRLRHAQSDQGRAFHGKCPMDRS
ncbi:MAG: FRG domain-containing protein [Acidobacteriaceae bacterium]